MIHPKRIHQFDTATPEELTRAPIWVELEVPGNYTGFNNRKIALSDIGGSGSGSGQIIDCGRRIGSGGERVIMGRRV